jgi:hypothetical protein
MTFWQFLVIVYNWLDDRWTRILGVFGGTLSVLLASGVIPAAWSKWFMAGIAVLTYWRGQSTANTVNTAKAIVQQTPVIIDKVSTPPEAAPSKP